jgi:hypothetical protein
MYNVIGSTTGYNSINNASSFSFFSKPCGSADGASGKTAAGADGNEATL